MGNANIIRIISVPALPSRACPQMSLSASAYYLLGLDQDLRCHWCATQVPHSNATFSNKLYTGCSSFLLCGTSEHWRLLNVSSLKILFSYANFAAFIQGLDLILHPILSQGSFKSHNLRNPLEQLNNCLVLLRVIPA